MKSQKKKQKQEKQEKKIKSPKAQLNSSVRALKKEVKDNIIRSILGLETKKPRPKKPAKPRPKKTLEQEQAEVARILNMSRYDLVKAKKTDLRKHYSTLKKQLKRNYKEFKANELDYKLSSQMERLKPIKEVAGEDLVSEVNWLANLLKSETSTYEGYLKRKNEDIKRARENLGEDFDKYIKTDADFRDYERFLHEMYIRDKDNWKAHYDDAMDLFVQARRLNLDENQFLNNYKYWLEHATDLLEATPINKEDLKPKDYAMQLRLPKIRGGGNYGEE